MTYRGTYQMGPTTTPNSLKILIWATIGTNIALSFFPKLVSLFAFNLQGIQHLYLWQFITYLFVPPLIGGLSFPFFLHLAFNMYLIWTFGASLILRSRSSAFLTFYFTAGIFAALFALATMSLFNLPYSLAGTSTSLYAILIAWMILNPESDILLFFTVPFKARWLILGLIGANLLIDLSNRDWIRFTGFAGGALYGYLFAIIAWREESPFSLLWPFERFLLRTIERVRNIGKKRASPNSKKSKIYDFHSGEPLASDEEFMDAMLARISAKGEDSLTSEEKKRMQSISARKASKKR